MQGLFAEMAPPEIMRLLEHHPDDPPGFFRFRQHKDHPFLKRIKIEFENNDNGTESTFVYWASYPDIQNESFRVQNAYDEHGEVVFFFLCY